MPERNILSEIPLTTREGQFRAPSAQMTRRPLSAGPEPPPLAPPQGPYHNLRGQRGPALCKNWYYFPRGFYVAPIHYGVCNLLHLLYPFALA
ncbi:hypothetical protein AVEN_239782-1 [Araneus ventricosus]|uniref:Uncharacterized protein n=1 Tax=Araneus ventricosus TaxID=182803 RepID=A0A4Y2EV54_ARAVE|nr:hypothetical protein AVEN_239782-1 [Araneus ventricosus]